jgi:hypothetical protein
MEETPNPGTVQAAVIKATAGDTFGHGWNTMKKYFPELLLTLFIIILFSLPMGLVNAFADKDSFGFIFFSLFNVAYGLIIMAPLSYGARLICLKAVRGEPVNVNEIFSAYRNTLQIALANLLVGVIVALGFVMLIVPGIIFACKLSMVPYLVMDKNMPAVEAVRASWNMTGGYSWTIFGMGLLTCLIFLAGLIMLVVGIFPAIIWITLAFAGMYEAIERK